jgi:hypothetical protein
MTQIADATPIAEATLANVEANPSLPVATVEGSEHGSEHGDDQDLGDLGAELEDGDDSNPIRFIERSLAFQNLVMQKRFDEERLDFFTDFAKGMKHNPSKKLAEFKARVNVSNERLDKFKAKYAKQRAETKAARAQRVAAARAVRNETEKLTKPVKTAISAEMAKKTSIAQGAAIAAIQALQNPSNAEVLTAGIEAYSKALIQSLQEAPLEGLAKPFEPTAADRAVVVEP